VSEDKKTKVTPSVKPKTTNKEDILDNLVIFFVSLSNHPSEKIVISAHEFNSIPATPYSLKEVVATFGTYDEMVYKVQQIISDLPTNFQYTEQADLLATGEERSISEIKASKLSALARVTRQATQYNTEVSNLNEQIKVARASLKYVGEALKRLADEEVEVEKHFDAKLDEAVKTTDLARADQVQALKGRASRNTRILKSNDK